MKLDKNIEKSTMLKGETMILKNKMQIVPVPVSSQQQAIRFANRNNNNKSDPFGLVKKKSCTALLCELTCLKSQQKYLECSQVKLNPDNYEDPPTNQRYGNSKPVNVAIQMINEIETLKVQLNQDLQAYRENSYREVQDLRESVSSIREDVCEPQRLSEHSLPALRERIININTQLMRLCDKNQSELLQLRDECVKLERKNEILIKL